MKTIDDMIKVDEQQQATPLTYKDDPYEDNSSYKGGGGEKVDVGIQQNSQNPSFQAKDSVVLRQNVGLAELKIINNAE